MLNRLITRPGYARRLARKGAALAAVSDNNAFFTDITAVPWPDHVAVQALHMGVHQNVEQKLGEFDLALVDGGLLARFPQLLDTLAAAQPGLPLILVHSGPPVQHHGLVLNTELARLPQSIANYTNPFRPELSMVKGRAIKENLLGIPERESLVYYRNRHKHKRLFIAASGPSLNDVNPEWLQRETVMTINDALVRFPFAQYAAIMDARKLHELHHELLSVDGLFTLKGNSYGTGINLLGTEGFSDDLDKGAYSGYTTAYFCLQIALYMGFKKVYYLGLDLGNTTRQSHFFGNRPLQDRDRPEVYAKMRQSFENIAPLLPEYGIEVYNCSPVSELKCFPFRPLEEVLQEPA